jgi:plastocyanin
VCLIRGELADATLRKTKGIAMNRSMSVLAMAGAALVLAAPASSHEGPVLIIRHQTRGCHGWSFNGGANRASLTITFQRGTHLTVGNNDVMPHKLVQLAGPALKLEGSPNLNSLGKAVEVKFAKAGVYRFTTRAGKDYSKGIKTVGDDHVLKLKVIVR